MQMAYRVVAFFVVALLSYVDARSIHVSDIHHSTRRQEPGDEDPAAEAERLAKEVNADEVKAAAEDAKESAHVAKQAAVVANNVADHSVKVTSHAKKALKHALHALHDARLESDGLDSSQKQSLQKAEKKLEEATQHAEYGKLKKVEVAQDNGKKQLQDELDKKKKGTELEQMRADVKELRHKLREKGGDAESDAELEQLQGDLEKLEQDANSDDKSDAAVSDEMKSEIERLRKQIDQYETKHGGKNKGDKELMKDVKMKDLETDGKAKVKEMDYEVTPIEEKGIDVDTQMPYGDLEPFGREDTAQELTESSVRESDEMVDQLERAEVAEEKRAVFRALTRLRGAAITSFDGVARSQTGNIDEYNKVNKWRRAHPLHHLADEESDISKWAFPDNADLLQVKHPDTATKSH
jgi:DNA repair exonuclease SbcCD ATPase subunit